VGREGLGLTDMTLLGGLRWGRVELGEIIYLLPISNPLQSRSGCSIFLISTLEKALSSAVGGGVVEGTSHVGAVATALTCTTGVALMDLSLWLVAQ
jgi:hypothetical protein